ncbi:hypothetical protein MASR2M78_29130 [Treponema sp.]
MVKNPCMMELSRKATGPVCPYSKERSSLKELIFPFTPLLQVYKLLIKLLNGGVARSKIALYEK